jgi:hypothetical protein
MANISFGKYVRHVCNIEVNRNPIQMQRHNEGSYYVHYSRLGEKKETLQLYIMDCLFRGAYYFSCDVGFYVSFEKIEIHIQQHKFE